MTFFNPIEILYLQGISIDKIDPSLIRKAKRRIFADIELSETGSIPYNGGSLTKSDAERVINELEDKDRIDFYHFIANNIPLNKFLSSGDTYLFRHFRQESIFKLPQFIDFISPYFSEKYDRALFKAFLNIDEVEFRALITIQPLVNTADRDNAFRSISNLLKERIKEVDDLTRDIKNEESAYDEYSVDELDDWIQEQLDINFINLLPQYFQSIRNQCATSIRNLSVNIFNAFGDSQLALNIIGYALDFEIDGMTKQRISNDYDKIDAINDRNNEEEQNSPILQKYAAILIGIKNKLGEIESISVVPHSISDWVASTIKIDEINALGDSFLAIRNEIALGLKALSIAIWNKFNDINVSYNLINLALSINTETETRNNILEAKNQAVEIKRKIELIRAPNLTSPSPRQVINRPIQIESKSNNGCLNGILILIVIGVIVVAVNFESFFGISPKSSSGSNYTTSSTTRPSNTTKVDYRAPVEKISQYQGNKLENGASPFDGCFGQGIYSGEAWINFENSNNWDAVVCLVNVNSTRTIRNEYIRAGASFKMTRIPSGIYSLKVYYGIDWNPTKTNFCGTSGGFDTDEHFSKSDNPGDLIEVSNSDISYTTGSITLYNVPNGNMTSETATASDFFKN